MTQITKTQVFSQIVDQKEHKNNWYNFGGVRFAFSEPPYPACVAGFLPAANRAVLPKFPSQYRPLAKGLLHFFISFSRPAANGQPAVL